MLIINKSNKSKNSNNEDLPFKKFLKKNKSLKFLLPILAIWILVLFIFVFTGGFNNADIDASGDIPTPTPTDISQVPTTDIGEPDVEVLPQKIRTNSDVQGDIDNDPFDSIMNLTGVVYAGENSTAIIEWGNSSYIVQINDTVGDSDWSIKKIERDKVTLHSGEDNLIVLDLSEGATNE